MKKFSQLLFALVLVLAMVLPTTAGAAASNAPTWMDTAINSKVNKSSQYYVFGAQGTKYALVVVDKTLFETSTHTGVNSFRSDGVALWSTHSPNIQAVSYQFDATGRLVKTNTAFKIGQNFGINGGGGVNMPLAYKANLDVLVFNSDVAILKAEGSIVPVGTDLLAGKSVVVNNSSSTSALTDNNNSTGVTMDVNSALTYSFSSPVTVTGFHVAGEAIVRFKLYDTSGAVLSTVNQFDEFNFSSYNGNYYFLAPITGVSKVEVVNVDAAYEMTDLKVIGQ